MKAAIFESFNAPLSVENLPDPECPADGVVVDVKACGVCRSDWHAWKGADPDVIAPTFLGTNSPGSFQRLARIAANFASVTGLPPHSS